MRQVQSTVKNEAGRCERTVRWSQGGAIAAIVCASFLFVMPVSADRSNVGLSAEETGPKAYWQGRYRTLLMDADRLRSTIESERELYADANRRNYRRGDKRHRHRIKMEEAELELERVLAELATIQDDGRRAGALPGWFYEVEAEHALPARASDAEDESDESGRNPLYLDETD